MGLIEDIAYKFIVIGGIAVYLLGLIGNTLNIYVFAIWCHPRRRTNSIQQNNQHHTAHTSNSSLYLLISSCANFLQIVYPVLTRIIFDGFQLPKTKDNQLGTCQLRYYVLHTSDSISLTCICMATLDRYLISSRDARTRRLTPTRRRTKFIIILIICFFGLHNIPVALYYQVSELGECFISSEIYLYYYLCIIQIFLHGIFPMCFLSIFGGLTYKQLRMMQQINQRRHFNSDKQLSRMLLLLCMTILISSIPYCIQNIYFVISKEYKYPLASYALLLYYMVLILFFTNATFSFYIFFLSTPNFRKQLKIIFRWIFSHRHVANNPGRANTSTQNT